MNSGLISDVSDTAFMVAAYRAQETERPNALFHDPLAGKLAGAHGDEIVQNLPALSQFAKWMVAIRTRVIDDLIEAAIGQGVVTVLNLGAGLDTRPYRMPLPEGLRWIEVDYPKIIELKENRLSDEKPRCRLERVKLDLTDGEARRRLLTQIATKAEKTLVLTEGVIPYLTTEAVAMLASELRAHDAFQYWIADYFSPEVQRYRKRVEKKMNLLNAPFRFQPNNYFEFFRSHGWRASKVQYLHEEAAKLNRPASLPFRQRWLLRLIGAVTLGRSRRAFAKSAAYVLFQPWEIAQTYAT